MSAPLKTRRHAAAQAMRMRAVRACSRAEEASQDKRPFCINDLPDDWRRAAHALLYAALAHCLAAHGKALPKTLTWQGRRWYLAPVNAARLQVSAYPGLPGIVSMPGALL